MPIELKQFSLVRFANEANGGPVHRVVSVMHDGLVELHDMGGYFAPHLFVVVDDIADIPPMPSEPTQYRPGSFGCHEALHMASVLAEMVDERLCEHPAVEANEAWLKLAEEARLKLEELYQAIGKEHMR